MPDSPFRIPDVFLQKLFELSGGAEKYKGFVLFCFDAEGNFTPIMGRNDPIVSIALQKKIEEWIDNLNNGPYIEGTEE